MHIMKYFVLKFVFPGKSDITRNNPLPTPELYISAVSRTTVLALSRIIVSRPTATLITASVIYRQTSCLSIIKFEIILVLFRHVQDTCGTAVRTNMRPKGEIKK